MPRLRLPDKSKRDPDEDYDATNTARDKFKGELKKLYESDNSLESEDDQYQPVNADAKKSREKPGSRRPKMRTIQVREPPMHSFVMKLFDRSVDLTQFKPDSPLYPICRDWFRNNPKSHKSIDIKKENMKKKDEKKNEKDCYRLPSPHPPSEDFTPSPAPPPVASDDFVLEYDPIVPLPTRDELLLPHIENWVAVRRRVRRAAQKKAKRYERSALLLRAMCNRL